MKIAVVSAHVSPLAALSGAGSNGQRVQAAELAKTLGRRGHQVTVYTRRDSATLPARVSAGTGVTVEHVPAGPAEPMPTEKQLRYMPEFGGYLADRWLRERPDVVHAHYWTSGMAALAGARNLGIPVTQTFHSLGVVQRRYEGSGDANPGARIRLEVAIARDADAVVATCSDQLSELAKLGVPRRSISVVPGGVDTDEFTPDGPAARRGDSPRLLTVSRPAEHKGLETTLRALTAVPDAELVIAGGPPKAQLRNDREYRRLSKLASSLGVADRVTFCGRVGHQDMPALLRSADLLINVPSSESFGTATLEAMACGTPVVASAVGGHNDTVVDGSTGALVPPREPDALARKIRDLLASPMLLQGYGIAAADRAKSRYSWDRIGQETLAVHQQVLRARKGRERADGHRPVSTHTRSHTRTRQPAAVAG
jgi:glycosyltransferase involved in cell wall biosynthesis